MSVLARMRHTIEYIEDHDGAEEDHDGAERRATVPMVFGAPAKAREMDAAGGPRWLCRDHMGEEAGGVLDTIEELRRKVEPKRQ